MNSRENSRQSTLGGGGGRNFVDPLPSPTFLCVWTWRWQPKVKIFTNGLENDIKQFIRASSTLVFERDLRPTKPVYFKTGLAAHIATTLVSPVAQAKLGTEGHHSRNREVNLTVEGVIRWLLTAKCKSMSDSWPKWHFHQPSNYQDGQLEVLPVGWPR